MYLVYWLDPEDPDPATSIGVEEFDSERGALDWLNNEVTRRPKIEPRVFMVARELKVRAESVATRFVIG